ncbi:LlaJI family restriction endonuclease [Paraclostridium bifermentans]|uniref:LlaJI family restriction endonuclease n=1 Tax=Paraclostridium bifermentans TaxID=1490 RepID=UPI0011593092|nr:LlaJI family restriction endonuclease [Paraclostridium bifermentans]TQO55607.1 LlaJI family restriction endonuclease [Paraclostridium bifermentans]
MNFKYEFEERWFNKENLDISSEFLDEIINHNKKIVEINKNSIKFTFVGVLVYKKEILVILPKYSKELNSESEKLECIKTIIKVFKRIPNKVIKDNKDSLFISNSITEDEISEIAIADYIIKDFRNNGGYIQKHRIKSINGKGHINWTSTINTFDPIISNDQPVYTNYINEDIIINNNNFISNLHVNLYNYLLVKYKELLGYSGSTLSFDRAKRNLDRLGNKKYILAKIKEELECTFGDRDINLLKAIYNFFEPRNDSNSNNLSIFGTISFEVVWEHICKYIFNDKYEDFKSEIPFPEWYTDNDIKHESKKNLLIPDIISLHNKTMFILDAKYYSIQIDEDKVVGNPGSYDIIKQHIYEMVFDDKTTIAKYKEDSDLNYSYTVSALIYPKMMEEKFNIFSYTRHSVFNNKKIINNVYVSPTYVYDLFINRKKIEENIYTEIDKYNQKKLKLLFEIIDSSV